MDTTFQAFLSTGKLITPLIVSRQPKWSQSQHTLQEQLSFSRRHYCCLFLPVKTVWSIRLTESMFFIWWLTADHWTSVEVREGRREGRERERETDRERREGEMY